MTIAPQIAMLMIIIAKIIDAIINGSGIDIKKRTITDSIFEQIILFALLFFGGFFDCLFN